MKHLSHFSRFLKLAVLFGAGALVGCHGGPDELSIAQPVATGETNPTSGDGRVGSPNNPDGVPLTSEQATANAIANLINTQQRVNGGTLTDTQIAGLSMTVMRTAQVVEDYIANNREEITERAVQVGNTPARKGSVTQSSGTYAVNGTLNTAHQIEVDFDSLILGRRNLDAYYTRDFPNTEIRGINISNEGDRAENGADFNIWETDLRDNHFYPFYFHPAQGRNGILGVSAFAWNYIYPNILAGEDASYGRSELGYFDIFTNIDAPEVVPIGDDKFIFESTDTADVYIAGSGSFNPLEDRHFRRGRGTYAGREGTWVCEWPCILRYEDGGAELSDEIEITEGFKFTTEGGAEVDIKAGSHFRIMEEDISIYADRNGRQTEIQGTLTCEPGTLCRWGPPADLRGGAVSDRADYHFYDSGSDTRTFAFAGGNAEFTPTEDFILEYNDTSYVVGGLWTNVLIEYGEPEDSGFSVENSVSYQFGAFVDGPVDGALVYHPAGGLAKFLGSAGVNFILRETSTPILAWADAEFNVNWYSASVVGKIFNFHRYYPKTNVGTTLTGADFVRVIDRLTGPDHTFRDIVLTLEVERYNRNRNSERFGFLYGHGEVHGGGPLAGWRGGYGAEFFGENAESLAGTFGASSRDQRDALFGFFITERCEHGRRNPDDSCPEACEHGARLDNGSCPPPPCEHGTRLDNGSCLGACEHGARNPDNSCPPPPCEHGTRLDNGSCLGACEHGARNPDNSCPPPPPLVETIPAGGFVSHAALTGYIGENAAAVSTAFTGASSVTVKIGSITQSSRTDGGETADQVGIANFYSIAAEANGADGISISALQIGNAGTGASWTEISGAGFNFDMQSTLEAGMMTLAGIHGALAIDGGGTLFMDVYTNIEAPVNTTPAAGDDLPRGSHDAIFPEGENGFVRRGRARMPHNSIEGRYSEGTWECVDISSCAIGLSPRGSNPSSIIGHVEGMTFTPDNGSVMTLSQNDEMDLLNEEITLIQEKNGRKVAVPGRLTSNSGFLFNFNSNFGLWTFSDDLSPRLSAGETIVRNPTPGVEFIPDASITESPDTDYLVGGVWAVLPESGGAFEVGAFADGVARLQDLPTVGMATYTGAANGLAYEDGSLFNFKADAAFTADWGDNSVNGSLTNFNLAFDNTSAEAEFRGIVPENFQLDLSAPFFGSDEGDSTTYGIFTDGNTTSGSDNPGWTGSWGGQFFGDEGSSLAGTFGAADADGKAMVGNFLTEKE